MRSYSLLSTLATLVTITLGAPSSPAAGRSTSVVRRDGPCDASSETCRPVLQANACFAAFIMFGTKEQILQCVDDKDPVHAEEAMCACYGCAEQVVQDWAVENLECEASSE
ncbi:hypothetical protein VTH82DRAFT_7088 [Thermothelomyces myriococcoides]